MFIPENSVRRFAVMVVGVLVLLGTAACSHTEAKYPDTSDRDMHASANDIYSPPDTVFGKGGGIFGAMKNKDGGAGSTGIGVNSFLWRASLDTVAFMPLASADPFGGVILTDWYSPPDTPGDRFKLNVFILDKQLRSDAVQVKVFKQVQKGGTWHDATVPDGMGRKIEDAILTRARQMRVAQMGNG